jgi:2-polyprenyl-3-methyl-5-hydroxy-6-metoxy-1,4-benzoquinol methylase
MKESIDNEYEYSWGNDSLTNAHSFIVDPLLSMLPPPIVDGERTKILDVGCGNGSLSNYLHKKGYFVIGVEESQQGVAIAQKNFPGCQFLQGSIYDFENYKLDKDFDVVISVEVIEHLFYPKELVRLAKCFLKPNGQLILTTPYHGFLKNLVIALLGKMDSHVNVLWDGGHIKFFSVSTLSKLLILEGYTDIRFDFAGRVPYLWKSMLCSSKPRK